MTQETPSGGTNARPLDETLAETGPGLPDEAIGPEQRSLADQTELAEDAAAQAMERKLQGEVDGQGKPA